MFAGKWQKTNNIDGNITDFMKKYIFVAIFILLSILVLAPVLSQAAGLGGALGEFKKVAGPGGAGAQKYTDVQDVVGAGIGAALVLVGMIFMDLMVYAGYLWMTARGEEEPIKKAQNIITAALIGFFIVASAYAITTFVSGRLGDGGGGQQHR
jgi:uncharacterized membrane protein